MGRRWAAVFAVQEVPPLDTFYASCEAGNVIDAFTGGRVDSYGAEMDELDGAEGLQEGCLGEDDFADAWGERGILKYKLLKGGSQDARR